MENYNILKQKTLDITRQISNTNDTNMLMSLKRELYETKLQMLDTIDAEKKRAGITARELMARVADKPTAVRYATGIAPLDEALKGGIEVGTLIQLAGASFSGKTHLSLELLANISTHSKAVFFNFEMGDVRLVSRLKRLLHQEQQKDNLIIDDETRSLSGLVMEISLYAKEGIKFFVIDSKMKLDVHHEKEDHKKFAAITKEMSKLSQQKDIIILLINQMSEADQKNNHLAFKGSGDQMYDTDIALFMMPDKSDMKNNRVLICSKNRQDEEEFRIQLTLDANGKTVRAGEGHRYGS